MIDDRELIALFREESEEHLQVLDEGLMRLEDHPGDSNTLQEVFRSAHSLKGAARMLGIGDVETLSHAFEDALSGAARGSQTLEPGVIEKLYGALDALRSLVDEATAGIPSRIDVGQVVAHLRSAPVATAPVATAPVVKVPAPLPTAKIEIEKPEAEKPEAEKPEAQEPVEAEKHHEVVAAAGSEPDSLSPKKEPVPTEAATLEAVALEAVALETSAPEISSPEISSPEMAWVSDAIVKSDAKSDARELSSAVGAPIEVAAGGANWKIETIRVEPSKLDALLAMAGELIVATTRAQRGRVEFDAIVALWEEENKAAAARERALRELWRELERGGAIPKDALPSLREMRRLGERETDRLEQLGALLGRWKATYEDVGRLDAVVGGMEAAIRGVRLLPLGTLFSLFARSVRDLAKAQGKEIRFLIEGSEITADKRILEELKDPLMHMVRNAIDHGIEPPAQRERSGKLGEATLRLRGIQTATQVVVELIDDGRGLDLDAIARVAKQRGVATEAELTAMSPADLQNLIFAPGFSTGAIVTDVSGRGVGLDVVRANVERLRGSIEVESRRGLGTTFRLVLPITLATTRVLMVKQGAHLYALPVESVESARRLARREVFALQGRPAVSLGGTPVGVSALSDLLEMPTTSPNGQEMVDCVVLTHGVARLVVTVDAVVDEQEIILKPLSPILKGVRNLMGATILDTGEVCLVLNPQDLIKSAEGRSGAVSSQPIAEGPARRKAILLAEDSITTRTQEKRILEGAGYLVTTAVDGLDAWQKLGAGEFDAVVSDVEMPNLDGLSLAARIRGEDKHRELPIILVTSLASEADRRRGVEVGANAYITKGNFDQKMLLEALRKFV